MKDLTSMNKEKSKIISEGNMPRRFGRAGIVPAFGVIGAGQLFLLIDATTTAPKAVMPAAIIVAVGWSIVMVIMFWPNGRTERRGRPSASALPTDVARPRSLQ